MIGRTMSANLMRRTLYTALATSLIFALNGCISPRYFSNKTVDVTNEPSWWGSLAPNRVLRLKRDVLVQGGMLLVQPYVARGKNAGEGVTVEQYKSSPQNWPSLRLVKEGTSLQCLRLKRIYSLEYSRYELDAKILDGDLAGQVVDIGSLVSGFADERGSLRPNSKLLETQN
jgi:hypothetical protein